MDKKRSFVKYQHIERFGTDEVRHIEMGEAYIFPKIDGTNASAWLSEGKIQAGSRKRHLTLDSDNAGFCYWLQRSEMAEGIRVLLKEHPNLRLFGEWLVPHSLKTYREDAWRRFYVFDVMEEYVDTGEPCVRYMHYNVYKPLVESYGIDFIPPVSIIRNASYEQLVAQLHKNVFLVQDGKGSGEGIVIKNYDYRNQYGRQTWAKIVASEFKEKHAKTMGPSEINGKKMIEEEIAIEFVTEALVEKEYEKIRVTDGWRSQFIPRLLHTVYHNVVTEESWNFVKRFKNPTIDFARLQYFCYARTKEVKPELF